MVMLALIVLGSIGNADYEDAKAAAALYDRYVCEGVHPDYEKRVVVCDKPVLARASRILAACHHRPAWY